MKCLACLSLPFLFNHNCESHLPQTASFTSSFNMRLHSIVLWLEPHVSWCVFPFHYLDHPFTVVKPSFLVGKIMCDHCAWRISRFRDSIHPHHKKRGWCTLRQPKTNHHHVAMAHDLSLLMIPDGVFNHEKTVDHCSRLNGQKKGIILICQWLICDPWNGDFLMKHLMKKTPFQIGKWCYLNIEVI